MERDLLVVVVIDFLLLSLVLVVLARFWGVEGSSSWLDFRCWPLLCACNTFVSHEASFSLLIPLIVLVTGLLLLVVLKLVA